MAFWFRPRIRHPFFPGLIPTPAREAKGQVSALYGSYAELEEAAIQGVSVERTTFVLAEADAAPLNMAQRDRLWELFQTPVYAILLSGGRVAAFECEALSGYHLSRQSSGGD